MEIATVQKRGEICIETVLSRTPLGLSVRVKTHQRVEEFMRASGGGATVDVGTVGRHWAVPKGETLRAYVIPPLQPLTDHTNGVVNLERLGNPLLYDLNGPVVGTNISFLRLVGISEGEGVKFTIKGVYSLDMLKKIRDSVGWATKQFYIDYLRPVDLTVQISTQELQF